MTLHLISTGNIGLNELVTLAVQRIYGRAAVAPAAVIESTDGKLEVVRAGNRTSYETDIGQWESVSEAIRGDLAVGNAPSFVEDDTGIERRILTTYWDCGTAWRTIATGAFENKNDPAVHRRAVYLRDADCSDLIERVGHTLEEGGVILESQQGPQEPAETPVPEEPEDEPAPPRKKPAKEDHDRWVGRAKELKGLDHKIETSEIARKLRNEDQKFNEQLMKSGDLDNTRTIRDTGTIRRVLTDRRKEWDLPPES